MGSPCALSAGLSAAAGSVERPAGRRALNGRGARGASLLVAALVTRLAQQLAVLLLGHPLAALLDDGAHGSSQSGLVRAGTGRRERARPDRCTGGVRRPQPTWGRDAPQAVSTALST